MLQEMFKLLSVSSDTYTKDNKQVVRNYATIFSVTYNYTLQVKIDDETYNSLKVLAPSELYNLDLSDILKKRVFNNTPYYVLAFNSK